MEINLDYIIYIKYFFVLGLLIIGSIQDIKKRIVKNEISASIMLICMASGLIIAILMGYFLILVYQVILFSITALISYYAWRIKVFGGGDMKIISVLGLLAPYTNNYTSFMFNFMYWYFWLLSLMLLGLFYGLVYKVFDKKQKIPFIPFIFIHLLLFLVVLVV